MTVVFASDDKAPARRKRAVAPAMKRGFRGKCPNCGTGQLFARFVTVNDSCSHCATELHHHRADDLPAYLVVLVIGHVIVGAAMGMQAMTSVSIWWQLALWVPLTVIVAILALKPVKGAVIGLQWALYMHGFGGEDETIKGYDAT